MSKVLDNVNKILPQYAEQCGLEIVDVEYKKGFNGMELTVFIDKDVEGGVSLIDCEQLHRIIDPVLDDADPTEGQPYQLSVSSPGIDRPLKREKDFVKNLDKEVNVSLFKKIDELKKFVAVLKSFDLTKGIVTLEYTDKKTVKVIVIELSNVATIKPEIKFN